MVNCVWSGLVVRFVPMNQPRGGALFEDQANWEVPEDPGHPEVGAPLLHGKDDVETAFSRN